MIGEQIESLEGRAMSPTASGQSSTKRTSVRFHRSVGFDIIIRLSFGRLCHRSAIYLQVRKDLFVFQEASREDTTSNAPLCVILCFVCIYEHTIPK